MLQGEAEATLLTPLALQLLFILYKCKAIVKKDPLVLSVVSSLNKKMKDQDMKMHLCKKKVSLSSDLQLPEF